MESVINPDWFCDSTVAIFQSTHNIDPCPRERIESPIGTLGKNNHHDSAHADDRAPKKTSDRFANPLIPRDLEAPDKGPELGVIDDAENDSMNGESEVIKAHRSVLCERMAGGILFTNNRRPKERRSIYRIADET